MSGEHRRFVGIVLCLVACNRSGPVTAPESPAPQGDEAAFADTEPTRAGSPARIAIPRVEVSPPAWFEPPAPNALRGNHFDTVVSTLATGDDAGLVSTLAGPLWLSRRDGVVGIIQPPKASVAYAFESAGSLLALDERGRLHRVADYEGAKSGHGWTVLPGPIHGDLLDAGGPFVVTAGRTSVALSPDRGETWTRHTDVPLQRIDRVFVRSDGVIAVQGRSAEGPLRAFTRGPRDKEWSAAPHDVGRISREGSAIVGDEYGCKPTLSSDGRRWVDARSDAGDWADWVSTDAEDGIRDVDEKPPGIASPPAPAPDATCDGKGGGLFGILGTGGGREPIRGSTGPSPDATRHSIYMFNDGLCRMDDDGYECLDEAPVRRPHVARFDGIDRTVEVIELPASCRRPLGITGAAGMALLRCEVDSGPVAFALGAQGGWHPQASLQPKDIGLLGDLRAGPDGTLLLHGECETHYRGGLEDLSAEETCEPSWIRAPLPLDADAAWSQLRSDTALAHRVLDGGRALKIAGSAELGYTLSVQAPTRVSRPVALISVPDHLLSDAWIDWSDRSIRVAFESEPEDVGEAKPWTARERTPPLVVELEGKLAPVDRAAGEWAGFDVMLGHERQIASLDFDGDGRHDVAVGGRHVSVLYADGLVPGSLDDACSDGRCRSLDLIDSESHLQDLDRAGDVDGDGIDDLAVTTCTWEDKRCRVNVVYGRRTHADRSLAELDDGTGGFVIRAGRSEYAWRAVGVGDLDGDGKDDLAVGRPGADTGGRLYVVYGKDDPEWVSLDDVERGVGGFVLRSRFAGAGFGQAIAGLGDIDGDGYGEIAVGAPEWDDERGAVFVIRGQARSRLMPRTLEDIPATAGVDRIEGTQIGAMLGHSVAAVGDVNADGHPDLAIAAPRHDAGEPGAGRVYVITALAEQRMPTPADLEAGRGGYRIEGDSPSARFGVVHSAVGDLNDDGHADVVVSSPATRVWLGWPDRIVMIDGATGRESRRLSVPGGPGSLEGLAPLGDLDGDGRTELGVVHDDPTPTVDTTVLHVLGGAPAQRR